MAQNLWSERDREEPEPGLPGVAPKGLTSVEHRRRERRRGRGVDHDRVRQDTDACGTQGAADKDVDGDRYRPNHREPVTEERGGPYRPARGDHRRPDERDQNAGESQRGGTLPEDQIRQYRHEDRLGAHQHHARRHARVVERGDPEPEMRPKSHPGGDPDPESPSPRERLSPEEGDGQEHDHPQGVSPEGDRERRSIREADKDRSRGDGEHAHGYGRKRDPALRLALPRLILYQRSAPISLKSCPRRGPRLLHIGLLYTGEACASKPSTRNASTALTQCKGSVTSNKLRIPLSLAIVATSRADSLVLRASSSSRMSFPETPASRSILAITSASLGGCSPTPPVGIIVSTSPAT